MSIVTIQEAQAKVPDLIHKLMPGDEVVITENNQPVAKLVSEQPKAKAGLRPPPGLGKGYITIISDDEEHLKDFRSTCHEGLARHSCDDWYIEGDPQLSATAKNLIQDPTNEVLISPAFYWEIAIKISIGKWQLNRPYGEFIDIGLNRYGFEVLPILPTHTVRLIELPFHHKDPFDRLLLVQGLVESIPIISNDPALDAYGIARLW